MPDLACAAAAARTTPLAPIRPAISISTRVIRLLTLPQFGECPAFMSTRPNGYPGRKGDTRSILLRATFHSSITCGFAPKATKVLRCREASLCAMKRREQVQQIASFDHLVGTGKYT